MIERLVVASKNEDKLLEIEAVLLGLGLVREIVAGLDWPDVEGVLAKVGEEISELRDAEEQEDRVRELGDLLFSVVNLARHVRTDPEMALRRAADRFATRFRAMEQGGDLSELSLEELDQRWEAAKRGE